MEKNICKELFGSQIKKQWKEKFLTQIYFFIVKIVFFIFKIIINISYLNKLIVEIKSWHMYSVYGESYGKCH